MRRKFIIGIVIVAIAIGAGLGIRHFLAPVGLIIKTSGTPSLHFVGGYVVRIDGEPVSKSVDGFTGDEYGIVGSDLFLLFQKQDENGRLIVQIFRGNQVVGMNYTDGPFGIVTLVVP